MKLAFPVATPETADETMLALRGPLSSSFRLLAELGYDGAELMVRDAGRVRPPPLLCRRLRAATGDAGSMPGLC